MPKQPKKLLQAEGLEKHYGSGTAIVSAINGVDLTLASGEFVAVMGASGSGKSTLLHLLGGLAKADAGEVKLAGVNIGRMSDRAVTYLRRKNIGVIFQAYNLMPTLNALDNVALPLLLAGNNRRVAREQAIECLDSVGMRDRAHHRPSQMSGGEQQRVTIARALVTQPKLILADEPTGNLDHQNAERVCKLLTDVAKAPDRAVVVVTHEAAVAYGADRIVILADGEIVDSFPGSTINSVEELSSRYLANKKEQ